jgi:predicted RNase H-like nuclease (RuvC/YqgF family)
VSNRAVPEKSKQIPFQPTKLASSSSVESRRQERKKYQDNDNKLKSKIGTLQTLVNDLKNENADLKKINGELEAVNKVNNSKLKQIDKFQANEQRAIQDLNSLCSTFIDTCIKTMSIDEKRDIDILSKRLQNTNSRMVFFQTLSRICLGGHIKRDRVDGGEWFKIRHDQKGHFGDDGRVRLFYHPSNQKIAVFYKSDEKKGKRFERNLPNLESRSKG